MFMAGSVLFAQDAPKASNSTSSADGILESKHSIALNLGLQGAGLEYAYAFNQQFALRGGFMTLPISITNFNYDFDGTQTAINANVNFTHLSVKADYYPFASSSFKIIGGFGYFLNNEADATILLTEAIYFGDDTDGDGKGDFVFEPDDIGQINIGLDWTSFNPFIGLGFGRAVPNKSVGFGMDFGMFYMGAPDVTINATNMLEDTEEEEAELEENLKDYAWLPQMNFRLTFRL
jgi:hypothetical protein